MKRLTEKKTNKEKTVGVAGLEQQGKRAVELGRGMTTRRKGWVAASLKGRP